MIPLSAYVFYSRPNILGINDVFGLVLFGLFSTSGLQDDQFIAIPSVIKPVTQSPIDAQLRYSFANRL